MELVLTISFVVDWSQVPALISETAKRPLPLGATWRGGAIRRANGGWCYGGAKASSMRFSATNKEFILQRAMLQPKLEASCKRANTVSNLIEPSPYFSATHSLPPMPDPRSLFASSNAAELSVVHWAVRPSRGGVHFESLAFFHLELQGQRARYLSIDSA